MAENESMDTSTRVVPAYYALLQQGSSGPDVAQVQTWLNGLRGHWPSLPNLTVDGRFGNSTTEAVKKFQVLAGIKEDGKVGQNTWNALATAYGSLHGDSQVYPGIALRQGQQGGTVKALQEDLNRKDNAKLNADGKFGSATRQAVQMFQHCQRLTADGVAGKNTWERLKQI